MGTVLSAAAAAVLLGVIATVLLALGARRRTALAVGTMTIVVLPALEVLPRVLGDRDLQPACLDGSVHAAVVGGPITWQALSGGLRVRAQIDADDVEQVVLDRVGETPLEDVSVALEDGQVDVSVSVASPLGELPLHVAVAPAVVDGAVRFEPVLLEVAGRPVPVGALDRLAGRAGREGAGPCAGGIGGGSLEVEDARVDPGGMSLTARW